MINKYKRTYEQNKILEQDRKNFIDLIEKYVIYRKDHYILKSFNIFKRNLIIYFFDKDKIFILDKYQQTIDSIFVTFARYMQLINSKDNWQILWGLNYIVSEYARIINETGVLQKITPEIKRFLMIEYLCCRFEEEKKIKEEYLTELCNMFSVNEEEQKELKNIKTIAIAKVRNMKFGGTSNYISDIAKRYVNSIEEYQPTLALILRDIAFTCGWIGLGKFIIMFHGQNIDFPKDDFFFKDGKEIVHRTDFLIQYNKYFGKKNLE